MPKGKTLPSCPPQGGEEVGDSVGSRAGCTGTPDPAKNLSEAPITFSCSIWERKERRQRGQSSRGVLALPSRAQSRVLPLALGTSPVSLQETRGPAGVPDGPAGAALLPHPRGAGAARGEHRVPPGQQGESRDRQESHPALPCSHSKAGGSQHRAAGLGLESSSAARPQLQEGQ